ncbi:MAG TPA: DinB family protein [Bryobacteraceae bacterium]|nr:DinB family protein [Bryobacteraceae bacterium]
MPIGEMLLSEFDQEMANTRKLLECVPDGKMDYKPHAKSMTLGRLAGHVAELPMWATTTLTSEGLDIQPGQQGYAAKSRTELLAAFDKNVAEARPRIASVTEKDLGVMWKLSFGGKQVFSMPRGAVLRSSCFNHIIHHRAQLGVYLRLNDVAIPGMYGPSADEAQFWRAQTS